MQGLNWSMMAFKEEPNLSDLKYKTYSRNDKWNGLKAYVTVMLAGANPIHQMYGLATFR